MKLSKKVTEDITRVMGIEAEMIPLLPRLDDKAGLLNPWVRQLPGIFRGLKLKANQIVLDIPCGKGGVSIPLAQKFGVKVMGFDVMQGYVDFAHSFAAGKGVGNLCTFKTADIRDIIKRENICDILLWIAAPHIWKTAKETIKSLRNCVKNNGKILIADAYCYDKYEGYETLAATNDGYTAFGDEIVKLIDYKGTLWKEDFDRTRKTARRALIKATNIEEKQILERHLETLNRGEETDANQLGLAIWVVQVNK